MESECNEEFSYNKIEINFCEIDKMNICIVSLREDILYKLFEIEKQQMQDYKIRMFYSMSHELKTPLNCSI